MAVLKLLLTLGALTHSVWAFTNKTTLALGDSITWGYGSSDGNGYRAHLKDLLAADGNTIDYVGSLTYGTMADNQNEGWIGATIEQISGHADSALGYNPGLIFLLAGTNDVNNSWTDKDGAPDRLAALVDKITSALTSATLIIGSLPPITDSTSEAYAKTFNAASKSLIQSRINAGKRIVYVDIHSALTVNDLGDGLHPSDAGYQKLAEAWYEGAQAAVQKGWLA